MIFYNPLTLYLSSFTISLRFSDSQGKVKKHVHRILHIVFITQAMRKYYMLFCRKDSVKKVRVNREPYNVVSSNFDISAMRQETVLMAPSIIFENLCYFFEKVDSSPSLINQRKTLSYRLN